MVVEMRGGRSVFLQPGQLEAAQPLAESRQLSSFARVLEVLEKEGITIADDLLEDIAESVRSPPKTQSKKHSKKKKKQTKKKPPKKKKPRRRRSRARKSV